jgi:pimeloyl-ACP methyl ester carboxylesterase
MRMATISVNGTQLYYEITGTSEIPVVMVHGSWGDHHNWDTVVPALARSFKVLTFDRRGHSQSAREDAPGTLHDDVMDLARLVEALDFAPAHIVGNSFGASITLRLACERPDLFRSLTAHEPPLFALLEEDAMLQAPLAAMEQRVGAVAELLRSGDMSAGARLFVETIAFGSGAWDPLPERMRQTFIHNARTWFDELQDPDWNRLDVERLRRFTKPALLTRGDQSPPFFPAVVAQVARALPHASQHLFAGAGHVPHVEQPAVYVDLVTRFITSVHERTGAPADFGAIRPTLRA